MKVWKAATSPNITSGTLWQACTVQCSVQSQTVAHRRGARGTGPGETRRPPTPL